MDINEIEAGVVFVSDSGERKLVTRVAEDRVSFMRPTSLRMDEEPLSDFAAWAVETERARKDRIAGESGL